MKDLLSLLQEANESNLHVMVKIETVPSGPVAGGVRVEVTVRRTEAGPDENPPYGTESFFYKPVLTSAPGVVSAAISNWVRAGIKRALETTVPDK